VYIIIIRKKFFSNVFGGVSLQGKKIKNLMYLELPLQRRIFPLQKASISKSKNVQQIVPTIVPNF
jgi:hypothetical protein